MRTLITPHVAADIIIELTDRPGCPILLIERKNPPHGWAIPGGFVDVGESVEQAAVREAAEETGLRVHLKALLGLYSHPGRDPRFHTVSAVYVAEARGIFNAADDAKNIRTVGVHDALHTLAFDHDTILADYRRFRETGRVAPIREAAS